MNNKDKHSSACDYKFDNENLQALWTEFQRKQKATCPETGAAVSLDLVEGGTGGEPTVKVTCEKCGRNTEFKPGPLEGFAWAE